MKRKRDICIGNFSSQKNRSSVKQNESDWEHCQDGFDSIIINHEKKFSSSKKLKAKLLTTGKVGSQNEDIDISWSSSDDGEDDDDIRPLHFDSPCTSSKVQNPVLKRSPSKSVLEKKQNLTSKQNLIDSQNTEASEVLISDYDSEDEDNETSTSDTQQTSDSFSISSVASSSLPSTSLNLGDTGSSPKKLSNLVNILKRQMKSPEATKDEPLDSGKKNSKYLRGGLAERLQKLIAREKSSIAMWRHRSNELKNNDNTTALTISVLKVHVRHGIYVSECLDITSDDQSKHRLIHVLFSTSTARKLHIADGSVVKVYPPWQKLNLPNYNEPVILCTHYCQLVGQDTATTRQLHTSTYQTARRKMNFDTDSPVDPDKVKPILEEVTIKRVTDGDDQASESILDSIADSSGHIAKGMCIRATVQRVCCYNTLHAKQHDTSTKASKQWFLILQDASGVFCEMQLPDGCHDNVNWNECLDGEGKTFIFKDAKVSQRKNRSRSVRLFSMLDSMWPPSDEILPSAFNSQSESSQVPSSRPPPSFCYTLAIHNLHNTLSKSEKMHFLYKPSKVCKLTDIKSMPSRFSFYAKVFYTTATTTDRHTTKTLYIADPSLQDKIESLSKGHSSKCNEEDTSCFPYRCLIVEASWVPESNLIGNVFMFKDILIENDLHADSYSRILNADKPGICMEFTNLSLQLQPLKKTSNQLELVSMQGVIVGADDSSAYHWPVCNQCGSDKLQVVSSVDNKFYCEVCQIEMVSTSMRIFLEVFIKCPSICDEEVKVQLLQSSIETILPPITEEILRLGFDLHCIIGKQLGPINAIVRNLPKTKNEYLLEEIQI